MPTTTWVAPGSFPSRSFTSGRGGRPWLKKSFQFQVFFLRCQGPSKSHSDFVGVRWGRPVVQNVTGALLDVDEARQNAGHCMLVEKQSDEKLPSQFSVASECACAAPFSSRSHNLLEWPKLAQMASTTTDHLQMEINKVDSFTCVHSSTFFERARMVV